MIRRSKMRMMLCVTLLILLVAFIWGNSLLPASMSSALSRWVRSVLGFTVQGSESTGEGVLRKLAHFSEFALLGVCLSWLFAMLQSRYAKIAALAVACAALTACVDETIQFFSPGRNPSLIDVGIDTAGAAVGVTLLFIGYTFIKNKKIFWRKTQ